MITLVDILSILINRIRATVIDLLHTILKWDMYSIKINLCKKNGN